MTDTSKFILTQKQQEAVNFLKERKIFAPDAVIGVSRFPFNLTRDCNIQSAIDFVNALNEYADFKVNQKNK